MTHSTRFLTRILVVSSAGVFLTAAADGQTGTWTSKTSMPTPRIGTAAGVINGQVYVAGGSSSHSLGANEVYDPVHDSWTSKSANPLPSPYAASGAINGKLYLAGGCGPADDCRVDTINSLQIYNPATDSWSSGAAMPTARSAAAAGVINGQLYVAGGQGPCPPCVPLTTLEVYDPLSNSWTTKSPMPVAVAAQAGAVVNGKLFVMGGYTNEGAVTVATVLAYDPITDAWTVKAPMPTARNTLTAGVINGILYAAGGSSGTGAILSTAEAYDPNSNSWSPVASMLAPKTYAAGAVVNGAFYVIGGYGPGSAVTATNEAFTPSGNAGGTFTSIDFPNAALTEAEDINNAGQIVGYYTDSSGKTHGFLDNSGAFSTVDFPGATLTNALGINNAGRIVGAYQKGTATIHGFLDSGGVFSLIDVQNAINTSPIGINDGGQIAGVDLTAGACCYQGFTYANSAFSAVNYPGAPNTFAYRNNDSGQIAGYYVDSSGMGGHGFLDSGGVFSPINVPGASATFAFGINNGGQIVGTYRDGSGKEHGFLDNGGAFTTVDYPGATGTEAWGINDGGQIVGFYVDSAGKTHGFLNTPPCSFSLTSAGQAFSGGGGVGSFNLITGPQCDWTMTFSAPWITPVIPPAPPGGGPVHGKGNHAITYAVAPNSGSSSRTGSISVGGQTYSISEQGLSCAFTVSPTSASVDDQANGLAIPVTVPNAPEGSNCPWTATSNAPWIKIQSGASGNGKGFVVLQIDPNTGGVRSGTATIAGKTLTVTQGAGPCGAVDVTRQVTVYAPGFWPVPGSLVYFYGTVNLRYSPALVPGPLYLVMQGLPNHQPPPNGNGLLGIGTLTTCFNPQGDYIVAVSPFLPPPQLLPSQGVTIPFEAYINSPGVNLTFRVRVLSGMPSH